MLSGSLAVLFLQAVPAVFGLQYRTADHSEYDQLQGLVDSARSTAVNLLQGSNGTCTQANLQIRREWDSFTKDQRKDYTRAVRCLQSTPALTPSELGSGIKTRYDDFLATHMNQTQTIHYTGNFLTWHRYYIHLYEKALREECAYNGTLPYWNWPKTAITGLHNSPIFDGSDTSMSGDGYFIPNKSAVNTGGTSLSPFWVPAGGGGGCVTSGPFANYTVNLGPVSLAVPGGITLANPHNDTGVFSWNPRCFRRDLTDYLNKNYLRQREQRHFSLGGDPARDLYVSPGDPAFYLHHTMMDRVWWVWQMQDPESRVWGDNNMVGTNTFMNDPVSANTTLEDWVQYGYATGPPRQIKDLLSTTSGPFCYVYE